MTKRTSQTLIDRQATEWVVRLCDAHSGADREAFKAWLAQDSAHQLAYDKKLASYRASGVLRTSAFGRDRDLESAFPRYKPSFGRFAVGGVAVMLIVGLVQLVPWREPVGLQAVMLYSEAQARMITLADGSKINLAPASAVHVELQEARRIARLRRGSLSLEVAKEERPFLLVAESASVEVKEGAYEARLINGQGSIKQRAAVTGELTSAREDSSGRKATVEFDAEPLSSAVAQVNARGIGPKIEIDADVAERRVTGVFHLSDSMAVARALARTFDLELLPTDIGTLRLSEK